MLVTTTPGSAQDSVAPFAVVDDGISMPLLKLIGDADRGRGIVVSRQLGFCLLCHSGPFPEEKFQGTIGPSLRGVGSRWAESQLRLRVVDASRLNPDTIMPPYYRLDQIWVAAPFRGKPILTAQQIEDVVVFLTTLRE